MNMMSLVDILNLLKDIPASMYVKYVITLIIMRKYPVYVKLPAVRIR